MAVFLLSVLIMPACTPLQRHLWSHSKVRLIITSHMSVCRRGDYSAADLYYSAVQLASTPPWVVRLDDLQLRFMHTGTGGGLGEQHLTFVHTGTG